MFVRSTVSILLVSSLICGGSLAQTFSGSEAPSSQAGTALPVKYGRVIDVQHVDIDVQAQGNSNVLGGVIGAAAGAFLARDGGWQGQALAGTLGAAAGAKAGQMISAEKRPAQQLIIQLDAGGDPVAVIQEAGGKPLVSGQKVYLIGTGNNTRVVAVNP
jgi:outer membrane lipoprotein SlyB